MFRFQSFVLSLAIATLVSIPGFLRAQDHTANDGGESLPSPIVVPWDSGAYGAINQLPASMRSSMPFAREFYEFARHAGSSGVVDNDAYRQAFEEARGDMLRERNLKSTTPQSILSNSWTSIGLTPSDTSTNPVPSAGITRAIEFDPQHPNIMYAGGDGGVWKSLDTGASWLPLTDNSLPNLSVNTIAIDPVNPDTFYVGTGHCENGIPPYAGSGLYRSTDGGANFEPVTIPNGGASYVKVLVDPSDHNVILASSFDKNILFRSTDAGSTWTQVSSVGGLVWNMIATPAPNSVLYASSTAGIYKSVNDGATWTKTTSSSNFITNIGRSALASPAMAPNKVFALVTDGGGSQVHLYLSTDAGTTWDSLKIESQIGDLFNPTVNAQGWYDLVLTVTPNSVTNDTLYIDGVMGYRYTGTDADLINSSTSAQKIYFSDYDHSSGGDGYPHVDHHSFAISPVNSSIVYDGDDGGLYVNYEAGSNDISKGGWILHSHNMVTNRIYHINLKANDNSLTWAGAQDQGLWDIKQGADPKTFPGDRLGDAIQPLASLQNSGIVYGEGPDGLIYQGLSSWAAIAPAAGWHDDSSWDVPFAMSPAAHSGVPSSSILYVGRGHLWQSTNSGSTWTKLNPSVGFSRTSDDVYDCSAIGLPNWDANLIYAAGGGNNFWASTNFGVSWVKRTFPVNGGVVTSIRANDHDPKFIVVSLELSTKKVMMSDDSGKSWTDVSGSSGANIPGAGTNAACNVMSIAIDSMDPLHTWYAGTDFGLFMTSDQGQHWSLMSPGLFPVRDVEIAANKTTMRIGTFGRGIWETTLATDAVERTSLSVAKETAGAVLAWYVEGEPAGAEFFVQRSVDGEAFQNIGSVGGAGESSGRHDYAFADNTTTPGTYLYRVHEVNADGSEEYTNQVELHYGGDGIYFSQPYPNPYVLNGASGTINMNFELPALDNVTVRIYSIDGTLVRTLLDHAEDGGPHTLSWDARDATGNLVAPGAYLCTVQSASFGSVTNKIMVAGE